jgi:uroporphyrinogen decarboxylase
LGCREPSGARSSTFGPRWRFQYKYLGGRIRSTQRSYDFVKSKTQAKIFYHSCGKVTEFIDDLVEIGVDIINPVQVAAMGDTAELKARFGGKVVWWGAVDTQRVLPHGSVEDVVEEVKQRIRDLAPGGGYVVGSVHNMQPDIPPENIVAMAEATRRHGTYPLTGC